MTMVAFVGAIRDARAVVDAGLMEVLVDDERGYESWRNSEAALAAARVDRMV